MQIHLQFFFFFYLEALTVKIMSFWIIYITSGASSFWSLFSVTFFACNYNGIIILFNLGLPFFYNLFPYASIVIVRICMHVLISLLNQVKVWVYVLVMSRTHFRVNTHSIFAWMSRNPLLETGAVSRLFRARSSLTSRQI